MSKRKPLPYHANMALDDIKMDSSTIRRLSQTLIKDLKGSRLDVTILAVNLGEIINYTHQIERSVDGIKRAEWKSAEIWERKGAF